MRARKCRVLLAEIRHRSPQHKPALRVLYLIGPRGLDYPRHFEAAGEPRAPFGGPTRSDGLAHMDSCPLKYVEYSKILISNESRGDEHAPVKIAMCGEK